MSWVFYLDHDNKVISAEFHGSQSSSEKKNVPKSLNNNIKEEEETFETWDLHGWYH